MRGSEAFYFEVCIIKLAKHLIFYIIILRLYSGIYWCNPYEAGRYFMFCSHNTGFWHGSFFSSQPHQIIQESWHISNVQVLFPKLLMIIIARSETMLRVWVIFDENIRAYSCENCCGVLLCKWIEHKTIFTNLVIHIAGYVVYARPIYPW